MDSTVTGLGLAVFGVFTVVYLTTELTALLAGRAVLPSMLRPLARVDRGQRPVIGAIAGRVVVLALGQAVVVGVLLSGIARRDPVAQAALLLEVFVTTLWVAWFAVLSRSQRRVR